MTRILILLPPRTNLLGIFHINCTVLYGILLVRLRALNFEIYLFCPVNFDDVVS
jgi:hypothetical protein